MKKIFTLILCLAVMGAAPVRQHTYTSGNTILSAENTANEDAIFNYLQAGVDTYKDDTIVNADVNSAANIQSYKLNFTSIAQGVNITSSGSFTNAGTFTQTGTSTFSGATISDLGSVTTADINGGNIDGTAIGVSSGSTITGTVVSVTTSLKLATGATCTAINDEDDMSSNSATALATQQSIKAYVDNVALSNVVFSWLGSDNQTSTTNSHVLYRGTSNTPDASTETANYIFFAVDGNNYQTFATAKYTHISTISTVAIHGKIWSESAASDEEAILYVDIGGQNSTATSTTSSTPTWYSSGTDIDVSGLTAGTDYTITIRMKNEKALKNSYCSGIMLIAG